MEPSGLIWMNGELVAWEDAKVHVLTHALHYGTGVFEGVRGYDDRRRHRRCSATTTTSTGCSGRPSSTTWRSRTRASEIRHGDARVDRAQRPAVLLHPPDRLPRLRPDGPVPARRPVDVTIAVWEWGAYLGDEGKRQRHPREGLVAGGASATTR